MPRISVHEEGLLSKPVPERVRLALGELGPTFVKFGQIVSSRRDLVTDEYYVELCKLQTQVPPFSAQEAKAIIAEELGRPVSEVFKKFNDKPVGSASIAQVHAARLSDGTKVAVKVQRPNIEEVIELDLAVLLDLARFVDRHVPEIFGRKSDRGRRRIFLDPAQGTRFQQRGHEYRAVRSAVCEQSLDQSSASLSRIDNVQSADDGIHFRQEHHGRGRARASRNRCGASSPSTSPNSSIFRSSSHGFFHGDPHPGNMLVLPGGVTGLLDYGMMGTFSPPFRSSIAHLIAGLAERDHQQVMGSILEMSEEGFANNPGKMLADVEAFSEQHLNQPLARYQAR